MPQDIAAADAADTRPEGPGPAACADAKDQAGEGGIAPFAGRQGGHGEGGELLCRHIASLVFGPNLGTLRLQYTATQRNELQCYLFRYQRVRRSKPLQDKEVPWTLNQRVQGSNPCTPTNDSITWPNSCLFHLQAGKRQVSLGRFVRLATRRIPVTISGRSSRGGA